jgi:hypothetical protein
MTPAGEKAAISFPVRLVLDRRIDADLLRGLGVLKQQRRVGTFLTLALRSYFASEEGRVALEILAGRSASTSRGQTAVQDPEPLPEGDPPGRKKLTFDDIFSG